MMTLYVIANGKVLTPLCKYFTNGTVMTSTVRSSQLARCWAVEQSGTSGLVLLEKAFTIAQWIIARTAHLPAVRASSVNLKAVWQITGL